MRRGILFASANDPQLVTLWLIPTGEPLAVADVGFFTERRRHKAIAGFVRHCEDVARHPVGPYQTGIWAR